MYVYMYVYVCIYIYMYVYIYIHYTYIYGPFSDGHHSSATFIDHLGMRSQTGFSTWFLRALCVELRRLIHMLLQQVRE